MIYTTEEIAGIVAPVAEKYGIAAVYLFGSYARGTAVEDSDIDLLIDTTGSGITTLFKLGAVYSDLEDALGKKIDLVTVDSLDQGVQLFGDDYFKNTIMRERISVYAAA